PMQFRHACGKALKEADLVVVAGFPFDFRLKYGRGFGKHTEVVSVNLSAPELRKNRRPEFAIHAHPAEVLRRVAPMVAGSERRWSAWMEVCRAREEERDAEIASQARASGELVDPIHFF